MSFVKLWMIAVFAVLLLGATSSVLAVSGASAQTPTTPTGTVPAETTTTTTASGDEPTKGESFAALVSILGGIFVSVAVVWLVSRAHDIQARLAAASLARGGSVGVVTPPAAAGREVAPATPDTISITGPSQVAEDTAGEFTVDKAVPHPTWSVSGIGSFTQLLKDGDHTFVFTPHEQKADVKVEVTDGTKKGEKPVEILAAAANPSFVLRVVVRNWGLVVVAVAIVFGAIALGVTGHLDGGNFVALVAPLAALLGVTAAVSERDGGGSAGGGASGGGSGGGAAGS